MALLGYKFTTTNRLRYQAKIGLLAGRYHGPTTVIFHTLAKHQIDLRAEARIDNIQCCSDQKSKLTLAGGKLKLPQTSYFSA